MPLVRSAPPASPQPTQDPPSGDETEIAGILAHGDVEARRAAIRQASRAGRTDLLAEHLTTETDLGLREAILTNLVRIGGPEAARPLIGLLRGEDAGLRNAAIETLQSMGEPIGGEIEDLLDDANPDIRIYAVNILQAMKNPRVPDIALRIAASDPHVNVCAAAVDILAEVGRPDMAAELRAVAQRFPNAPFLAFAVRAALNRIG